MSTKFVAQTAGCQPSKLKSGPSSPLQLGGNLGSYIGSMTACVLAADVVSLSCQLLLSIFRGQPGETGARLHHTSYTSNVTVWRATDARGEGCFVSQFRRSVGLIAVW
jgi:hypothetical protein